MIDPNTAPGTPVICIDVGGLSAASKFFVLGGEYIVQCTQHCEGIGWMVRIRGVLEDNQNAGWYLSRFKYKDLPECLTSLQHISGKVKEVETV